MLFYQILIGKKERLPLLKDLFHTSYAWVCSSVLGWSEKKGIFSCDVTVWETRYNASERGWKTWLPQSEGGSTSPRPEHKDSYGGLWLLRVRTCFLSVICSLTRKFCLLCPIILVCNLVLLFMSLPSSADFFLYFFKECHKQWESRCWFSLTWIRRRWYFC